MSFTALGKTCCRALDFQNCELRQIREAEVVLDIEGAYVNSYSGAIAIVAYLPGLVDTRKIEDGFDQSLYFGEEGSQKAQQDQAVPPRRKVFCLRCLAFQSEFVCRFMLIAVLKSTGARLARKGVRARLLVPDEDMAKDDAREGIDANWMMHQMLTASTMRFVESMRMMTPKSQHLLRRGS